MPTRIHRRGGAALAAMTLAALAVLLAPASPAAAHNSLRAATPAQNARLVESPKDITLEFQQRLDPAFTTIVLSDTGQRKVPTGVPTVAGTTGTLTIDQPLANGSYTVAYRVVSVDGHPVQGSYSFTVADPTADVAPDVPVSASAGPDAAADPAASADAASTPRSWLLALGGLVVVGVVAGVAVLRRRRRAAP
ncbi:copper resistance protein CopC [Micromonospora costi]|uniref:copper resistance CopC family protein n=1 Tax=Micromonospora costi TaxID=1530042 RepID=UPI0034074621